MRMAPSLQDAGWTVVEPDACGGRRGRNWVLELPAEDTGGEQEGPENPDGEKAEQDKGLPAWARI